MITDWEHLLQPLREEVQEHGALLHLFEEQQAAILQREPDVVLQTAESITKQLDLIRDCQKRRKDSVRSAAMGEGCSAETTLTQLIPYFPSTTWPMLESLIGEINRLARHTRRRARQNQMLLARTIEVSQEILRRLNPSVLTMTYSPEGRVEIASATAKGRCVARS